MSRIGKAPVTLPKGVEVKVDGQQLTCKGPKGSLSIALMEGITAAIDKGNVVFTRAEDTKILRAMHGTSRAILSNMVEGVTTGFSKKLEIVGVGYKAVMQGKKLALNVGFANTIEVMIPDGVQIKLPDPNHVEVTGLDKQLVGQVAANIRAARKPEPYKGKGVRYSDEVVRRKAGKANATAGKK
ncbi:MAG: 50S ribosomal protein L6 [Planctomycetes bacterium]|nr:50S ribosomal protein L6 [Planctomycetota bacterium]